MYICPIRKNFSPSRFGEKVKQKNNEGPGFLLPGTPNQWINVPGDLDPLTKQPVDPNMQTLSQLSEAHAAGTMTDQAYDAALAELATKINR